MRAPWIPFFALAACSGGPEEPVDTAESDSDTDGLVIIDDTASTMDSDSDVDTDPPEVPRTPCTADGAADLSGWCDLSVNNAFVDVPAEAGGTLLLRMEGASNSGPNPPGGFNGQGFGNRTLAGLHQLDGTKLTDLGTLELQARPVTGSVGLDLVLRVDLGCDGGTVVSLIAPDDRWTVMTSQGWQTRTATSSKFAWYAYGGLDDPGRPGEQIADDPLQANPPAQPVAMDTLTTAFPNACLDNGLVTEASLPPGSVSAVMLSAGSDLDTSSKVRWEVRSVTLGGSTWASPTE